MKKLIVSLLCLAALPSWAQTQLADADLEKAYTTRTYSGRISCHDPSIVVDDVSSSKVIKYYIYGSHLGRGVTYATQNYQSWSTFKTGEESTVAENSLFANVKGTLVNYANAYSTHAITKVKNYKGEEVDFGNFDAHAWQNDGATIKGNQWAPDIIYNKKMGKWCMYMSVNGDKWCSSIVCLTSKSIEGPWIYQGPVVCSGFRQREKHNGVEAAEDWKYTDLAIATGATSLPARYDVDAWGSYWPNCIDPCVFYDDDDNLWMSYGSWSGGIFMLKLNEENGLRDYEYAYDYEVNGKTATPGAANANCTSDPYFGKKIAGGHYVSGEASYIKKIGNHWFLFLSYGYLDTKGGYQMRIFRADNPTGPYKDCYGTSALYNGYVLNYGSGASDNRGMLLMGGYQWDMMPTAEIAQGHNSAFTDKDGRSFVVYHTRFDNGTEWHEVRVHQLFLNEEGWLMAAPFEFSGETITNEAIASEASIADEDIPGDYQFIRHQYNQNTAQKAYEKPIDIKLTAAGRISGGATGTWKRTAGTDFITLTIGGVKYQGVLAKQRIDYSNINAIGISALSSSSGNLNIGQNTFTYQQEVWAVKADAKAAIKYTLDKLNVPFETGSTINERQTLPTTGYLGAKVTWTSSNTKILTNAGVIRGKGDVVLTMKISKDDYVYTKDYNITVDADAESVICFYPVSQQKNTSAGWWTNFSMRDYTLAKGKKLQFQFYNYSSQANNWSNWCLYGASATHGAAGYVEYFGIRNDNMDNTAGNNTGCKNDFNWGTFKSDMNGSLVNMTVEYDNNYQFKMTSTITTKAGKDYHYSYTKTLSQKPAQINLFFVNEGSYIDGSSLTTGIAPIIYNKVSRQDGKMYNLAGQQVDENYKGIVIVNGKKFVNK